MHIGLTLLALIVTAMFLASDVLLSGTTTTHSQLIHNLEFKCSKPSKAGMLCLGARRYPPLLIIVSSLPWSK